MSDTSISKRPLREAFLPFSLPWIGEEEIAEVVEVLRSGWLTTGPKVQRFEEAFGAAVGAQHAVGLSSCTAALHLALAGLGIGPGDEVITTTFTFAATVNVILHVGARPVLVDVRTETWTMDPAAVEAAITPRTAAIIPVHYAGHPCDMSILWSLARRHGLAVVEDAAHALGAALDDLPVGSGESDAVCFSFYPIKNITTGEGGMLVTPNADLASRVRQLSLHGISRDAWQRSEGRGSWYYEVRAPGFKYNMTDIQAAIGLKQLERMPFLQNRRKSYAKRYDAELKSLPGIVPQAVVPGVQHARHLYPIRIFPSELGFTRDEVIRGLAEAHIGTSVHYIPIHLHPYASKVLGYQRGDFPVSEAVYEGILSLPLYPKMSDADVEDVLHALRTIVASRAPT
ncbi:MAG: DegT/DnrJ/EryC1/StrS family aminotransferase [bacterium]|nr:DegT/DnrJ/EryC1/StrS family aminotransferase [bacterium]